MSPNPLQNPRAFDSITLDKAPWLGICERVGGGERTVTIEDQQSPLFAGAYSVQRTEKIATVEYMFKLWTVPHFAAWKLLHARMRAGQKRPPKVWELKDLRLDGNEIGKITIETIGPQEKLGAGIWGHKVLMHEWKPRKPIGGPIQPATKTDIETKAATEYGNTQSARIDAHNAARAAAKRP